MSPFFHEGLNIKIKTIHFQSLHIILPVVFWGYACLVYGALNRIGYNAGLNRFFLISLIVGCLFTCYTKGKNTLYKSLHHPVDRAVLLYLFYILISFNLSLLYSNFSVDHSKTFILNCFLPILFFFIFSDYPNQKTILYAITFFVTINAVIAILSTPLIGIEFDMIHELAEKASDSYGRARLNSLIGKSTVLGYFCLIVLSAYIFLPALKFRPLILPIMLLSIILSFQRGVWIGIPIIFILFMLKNNDSLRHKWQYIISISLAGIVCAIFVREFAASDIIPKLIGEKLDEMTISQSLKDRSFQHVIHNNDNFFLFLTGEGYGKYSPLIFRNPLQQPDAPYHMIFNETGIIGICIYANMIFQIFKNAWKRRNFFILFIIIHFSVQMSGSRILWYFPINFLFYMLIGLFKNMDNDRLLDS